MGARADTACLTLPGLATSVLPRDWLSARTRSRMAAGALGSNLHELHPHAGEKRVALGHVADPGDAAPRAHVLEWRVGRHEVQAQVRAGRERVRRFDERSARPMSRVTLTSSSCPGARQAMRSATGARGQDRFSRPAASAAGVESRLMRLSQQIVPSGSSRDPISLTTPPVPDPGRGTARNGPLGCATSLARQAPAERSVTEARTSRAEGQANARQVASMSEPEPDAFVRVDTWPGAASGSP